MKSEMCSTINSQDSQEYNAKSEETYGLFDCYETDFIYTYCNICKFVLSGKENPKINVKITKA